MKIVFLDIDGVLNDHAWMDHAGSCDIKRECVLRLNRILRETGAVIVVSSAWRYMVHGEAMTLQGFAYMMRTHGLLSGRIHGLTCTDELIAHRGDQIAAWLAEHDGVESYVVLDDDDGFSVSRCQGRHAHPFVRTDGAIGLTDADADRAIAILTG
jgi:hypothetical protein